MSETRMELERYMLPSELAHAWYPAARLLYEINRYFYDATRLRIRYLEVGPHHGRIWFFGEWTDADVSNTVERLMKGGTPDGGQIED